MRTVAHRRGTPPCRRPCGPRPGHRGPSTAPAASLRAGRCHPVRRTPMRGMVLSVRSCPDCLRAARRGLSVLPGALSAAESGRSSSAGSPSRPLLRRSDRSGRSEGVTFLLAKTAKSSIAIEKDNAKLQSVLPKDYARPALNKVMLGELIDLISGITLNQEGHASRDILGRVYEYFLGQFAGAEGK